MSSKAVWADGWDATWGTMTQSVPLGSGLNIFLVLMLAASGYVVHRKKPKQGLLLLSVSGILGFASADFGVSANATAPYVDISTLTQYRYDCVTPTHRGLENRSQLPITINLAANVSDHNYWNLGGPGNITVPTTDSLRAYVGVPGACYTGLVLQSGAACDFVCNTTAAAMISGSVSANSGFASGSGSSGSPFLVTKDAPSPHVTLTLQNTGTENATSFSIGTAGLSPWSLANNLCGATIAAGASCTFDANLATSTAGAQNLSLSGIQVNWTDPAHPSGTSQNLTGTVYATVQTPPAAAVIGVSSVTPAGFLAVAPTYGASFAPLELNHNATTVASATLALTYVNSGSVAATGFTTNMPTLPNGWGLTTHGCNAITLAAAGQCTDTYTFSSNGTAGITQNFDTTSLQVSWNDGTAHTNQTVALPTNSHNTANVIYTRYYFNLFVSASTHNGQFSTASGGNDAITNADSLCNADANKPADGTTYKALLAAKPVVDSPAASRYACTSDNCSVGGLTEHYNWVLQPNTPYYTISKSPAGKIGTTDANGVFPLSSSMSSISAALTQVWTGLTTGGGSTGGAAQGYYDWMTAYPGYTYGSPPPVTRGNCSNWTSNSSYDPLNPDPLASGSVGRASMSGGSGLFMLSSNGCNNLRPLYCVQQP